MIPTPQFASSTSCPPAAPAITSEAATAPAIVQTVRARSSAYWSRLRADEDERARALLSKYQSGGAVLSLEEVEYQGTPFLALACDLSGIQPERRAHAFAQMTKHARTLQRALELEAAPDDFPTTGTRPTIAA